MFSIEQELIPIQTILEDCFKRVETKLSAMSYFQGLISTIERKNSWQLAEQAGCGSPYAFQYLLGRATWDVSRLRDSVSQYTVDFMPQEEGVLSLDETGFLKKGNKSAGVGRQYTGTAGRIENCQVGVFLSYATSQGRALIDRELYIPQDWFFEQNKANELLKSIGPEEWQTISAGSGSKGQLYYQWTPIVINSDSPDGWERWLLIRACPQFKAIN